MKLPDRPRYYRLNDDHTVTPCSLEEWAEMMEGVDRRVAVTDLGEDGLVSTVFLGLDHQYFDGPPLLFETMVFGGETEPMWRYSTYEQARFGHQAVVDGIDTW